MGGVGGRGLSGGDVQAIIQRVGGIGCTGRALGGEAHDDTWRGPCDPAAILPGRQAPRRQAPRPSGCSARKMQAHVWLICGLASRFPVLGCRALAIFNSHFQGWWQCSLHTWQPICAFNHPFLHRLIWEVWMPFVRNIVTQWQPRNCDPMVDFLDSWVHIIPVWILDNILDQLVFPKLQKEVGPVVGKSCRQEAWGLV